MSSIEERLARDIAAVTGGVVVTDSDLRDARKGIDDRIGSGTAATAGARRRGRRGRRRRPRPGRRRVPDARRGRQGGASRQGRGRRQPDRRQPRRLPHRRRTDGRAPPRGLAAGQRQGADALRPSRPGVLRPRRPALRQPRRPGPVRLDGDTIRITVDGGPDGCGGRQIAHAGRPSPKKGSSTSSLPEPGEGACAGLQDERLVMERMLPRARATVDYLASKERGWQALTDTAAWSGRGSPKAVATCWSSTAATYHVATGTGEQVDYGEWALERGKLTLTSWPDSVDCSTSDILVMGGLEFDESGTTAIRSDVQRNDCGGDWTPKTRIDPVPGQLTRRRPTEPGEGAPGRGSVERDLGEFLDLVRVAPATSVGTVAVFPGMARRRPSAGRRGAGRAAGGDGAARRRAAPPCS